MHPGKVHDARCNAAAPRSHLTHPTVPSHARNQSVLHTALVVSDRRPNRILLGRLEYSQCSVAKAKDYQGRCCAQTNKKHTALRVLPCTHRHGAAGGNAREHSVQRHRDATFVTWMQPISQGCNRICCRCSAVGRSQISIGFRASTSRSSRQACPPQTTNAQCSNEPLLRVRPYCVLLARRGAAWRPQYTARTPQAV
jgi:hypothetical protein